MKKLLVLAALLLPSFSALFAQEDDLDAHIAMKERVLKAIDDQCGDTWCEGDFYYIFKGVGEVDFSGKSVAITFIMGAGKEPDSFTNITSKQPKKKFTAKKGGQLTWVSCTIPGYANEQAIMSGTGLNWDFYLALSDCINAQEKHLNTIR